jgi:hypothetical protein
MGSQVAAMFRVKRTNPLSGPSLFSSKLIFFNPPTHPADMGGQVAAMFRVKRTNPLSGPSLFSSKLIYFNPPTHPADMGSQVAAMFRVKRTNPLSGPSLFIPTLIFLSSPATLRILAVRRLPCSGLKGQTAGWAPSLPVTLSLFSSYLFLCRLSAGV